MDPRGSQDVPGGASGSPWGLLGALEIIEKPLVLSCFQQWGPAAVVFIFFLISDRLHDRFFDFRSDSRSFLVPGCP